jgi:ABC-type Fe3+ transport system permease subunit
MVSFMLIFGLIIGVIYGLKQELKERSRPNQGIWNSFQNMLWTTAFSFPFGVIFAMTIVVVLKGVEKRQNLLDMLGIVFRNLPHLLLPGLLISLLLFGFFAGGGQACLQHLSLRLVLWQSGESPGILPNSWTTALSGGYFCVWVGVIASCTGNSSTILLSPIMFRAQTLRPYGLCDWCVLLDFSDINSNDFLTKKL